MASTHAEPFSKKRGRPRKEDRERWRILKYGAFDRNLARDVSYTCVACGHDAMLPVIGLPLAQLEQGIVFDVGPRGMPAEIQCPRCRRILELA